ncbi:Frag1/DRAM/Sfk1 family-domain-containing protein [Trametes punicea]|nr:Frag1/DRAM/Sfk1 family-domain-containing protein [Trametes punicea]
MLFLPHQHEHWLWVWIPLFGAFIWFATLWALLITWLASGRPHYVSMDGKIAYISDVGADILKPLFIVGCCITGASFFLSSAIERWLRHEGRLVANMRRRERVLACFAIIFAFVGMCGLILLSIFDTKRFPSLHRVFLLVFMLGVGLSAIFTVVEYRWISHDFVEIRKLKKAYIAKGTIAGILILLAIAFAVTLFQATDPGAILEWTIAFGFTFYILTFFFDLRMAKGVHKGELSRQRLLAMRQRGRGATAAREANEAGGGPSGYGEYPNGGANGHHANGYPAGPLNAGANGQAQMSSVNGPSTFGRGNAPIAYPANARAANRASAGYP